MKAITLWQPWASLIAVGAKRIETRSWKTSYRGPIAIHAAQRKPVPSELPSRLFDVLRQRGLRLADLPLGAMVATAESIRCLDIDKYLRGLLPEEELACGDFSDGRWAWVLERVTALPEPIPAKGKQGLWEWPAPADGRRA